MLRTKISNYINSNSNLKSIFVLASGTGLAQIISIASAPIVARLYTTSEFGIYAIYYAILTIISGFINLEYTNAIILSKSKEKSHKAILLCLIVTFLISVAILFFLFFFKDHSPYIKEEVKPFLIIIPFTAFLNSLNTILYYYFLRMDFLKFISKNKIIMAVVSVVTQVTIGFFNFGALGLIFANIISLVFCNTLYIIRFLSQEKLQLNTHSFSSIIVLAKEYKNFPLIGLWGNLLNIVTLQIPDIFLSSFASLNFLGQYSMANRVVSTPVGFIATAIQETFRKNAAKAKIEVDSIKKVYVSTFKIVLISGVALLFCLIVIFPPVFVFVFGEKWQLAGSIIKIMSVLYITRYIVSPLSYTFYVLEKQKVDLLWQIGLFIITIASLYGIYKFKTQKIDEILIFYVVSISLWYVVNLFLSYKIMIKKI